MLGGDGCDRVDGLEERHVSTAHNGKFGMILVIASGMTLYRYTPDKKNVCVCSGA